MELSEVYKIVILAAVALVGWFSKTLYDSIMKKIDSKVDSTCHNECSKNRDHLNDMLLEEIRGLRNDFKTKSEIVVSAVTQKRKKK